MKDLNWWMRLVMGVYLAVIYTVDPWGPSWFVSLNLVLAGVLLCTVMVDWEER